MATKGALTASAVKTLIDCFNEPNIRACVEAIQSNSEILAYQGFDPAITIKILLEKHETAIKKEGITDLKLNRTDFNAVMSYCIAIFLTRGTNWDNIKRKSTLDLQRIMDYLSSNYAIRTKQSKEKGAPEPKVITLSRIAASLPHITVTLFHAGIGRTLLPEDKYQLGNIPRVLLCPNIASLLFPEHV